MLLAEINEYILQSCLKQSPEFMMVVGTFALFWKQTLKPFLYFHLFFFHTSFNSLISLKLDIALTKTLEKYILFAR